jgi:hypothetical protein
MEMILESKQILIRKYRDTDKADIVGVWHRSGIEAYTYLPTWQALTIGTATWVLRTSFRRMNYGWYS